MKTNELLEGLKTELERRGETKVKIYLGEGWVYISTNKIKHEIDFGELKQEVIDLGFKFVVDKLIPSLMKRIITYVKKIFKK